jgi:hypothetical protein
MRRLVLCSIVLIITLTIVLTGCSSVAKEEPLNEYQIENARLEKENAELKQFKDRFSFSLSKIEDMLYNIKNEGYLPLVGSQVNASELISALQEIKNIAIEKNNDDLILSIMPQEWSEDFNTILIVYDVYKPVLNMASEDAGTVTTMAGIFKKIDKKWELVKFTQEFKGDDSFTIKGM